MRNLLVIVIVALLTQLFAHAQAPDRRAVLASIDTRARHYGDVALQIWGFAEVGYQEQKSSALLQEQLRSAGFTVKAGVAEIPTAFTAEWGSGKPVIGIIGEFDALPGLSQAAEPERRALQAEGAGHGCGHHLFGTASTAAAIAVKEWLEATRHGGTLRFYGTPAEEGGAGKVYMLRAGLFDDVDAVVTMHPGDRNAASASTNLANITGKFRFRGLSAHASAAPDRGRSALDGVEAMNAMVNLMREHVPSDARIHYVITNGGKAPNVVPDFAEVYYYARHNDMRVLDGIWERITNAARGAALGTGTTMERRADWRRLERAAQQLPGRRHAEEPAVRGRIRVHPGRAAVRRDSPEVARRGSATHRQRQPGFHARARHRGRVHRPRRRELAASDGAVDGGDLGPGHPRPQLAGGRGWRHVEQPRRDELRLGAFVVQDRVAAAQVDVVVCVT